MATNRNATFIGAEVVDSGESKGGTTTATLRMAVKVGRKLFVSKAKFYDAENLSDAARADMTPTTVKS